ncbi:MAG TPA: hypothetical protein VGL53_25345 [Bryobacteraceae bacterium]|jgi:hypothetical protein
MKTGIITAVALVFAARPASAHRLDEYLQATLFSIEKDRVRADIRLTPGVAVLPYVLKTIDTNGDGIIAASEQRAYVGHVMQDLSLNVDGERVPLQLISSQFPSMQEMKDGLGEIQISLTANLPLGGSHRTLVFENHHESPIAAYLVNCLAPADPDIRVSAQNRNYLQSRYQLDYIQAGGSGSSFSSMLAGEWFALAAVLILGIRLAWLAMPHLLNRRTSGSAA